MNYPGDNGVQGYPTENLEIDPDATIEDAENLIRYAMDTMDAELPSDAVINLIDFRKGGLFKWTSDIVQEQYIWADDDWEPNNFGTFKVVSTNQWGPGLEIIDPDLDPRNQASLRLDEIPEATYERLLRDWLRGDVIRVNKTVTFTEDPPTEPPSSS